MKREEKKEGKGLKHLDQDNEVTRLSPNGRWNDKQVQSDEMIHQVKC